MYYPNLNKIIWNADLYCDLENLKLYYELIPVHSEVKMYKYGDDELIYESGAKVDFSNFNILDIVPIQGYRIQELWIYSPLSRDEIEIIKSILGFENTRNYLRNLMLTFSKASELIYFLNLWKKCGLLEKISFRYEHSDIPYQIVVSIIKEFKKIKRHYIFIINKMNWLKIYLVNIQYLGNSYILYSICYNLTINNITYLKPNLSTSTPTLL